MSTQFAAPVNVIPPVIPNQLRQPTPVSSFPPAQPFAPTLHAESLNASPALLQAYNGLSGNVPFSPQNSFPTIVPMPSLPQAPVPPQNRMPNAPTPFSMSGPVPGMTAEQAAQLLQGMMAQEPNGSQGPQNDLLGEPAAAALQATPLLQDASNGLQPNFVEGAPSAATESPEGGFFNKTWKIVTAIVVAIAALVGGYFIFRSKPETDENKTDGTSPAPANEAPKENPPAPPANNTPPVNTEDKARIEEILKELTDQIIAGIDSFDNPSSNWFEKAQEHFKTLSQQGLIKKEEKEGKSFYTLLSQDNGWKKLEEYCETLVQQGKMTKEEKDGKVFYTLYQDAHNFFQYERPANPSTK